MSRRARAAAGVAWRAKALAGIALALVALAFIPAPARAYIIESFDSKMVVSPDAILTVGETIRVDFTGESRHGIYRDIPLVYDRNGLHYRVRVTVLAVADERNNRRRYDIQLSHGKMRIRIGDPDVTVTGLQVYTLRYEVTREVNFFDDHDEIYIGATGNFWDVTIQRATAEINTSFAVPEGQAKAVCYTGPYGSQAQDCDQRLFYGPDGVRFVAAARAPVGPGEGLTLSLWIPKGLIRKPSVAAEIFTTLFDNWPFLLPLAVLLAMFWIWLEHGRELPLPPIAVQYEAPKLPDGKTLRPGEIGVLIDERADMTDITATIVDLAVRGYLKIAELETTTLLFFHSKDYEFTLLKQFQADPEVSDYEKEILEGVFGGLDQPNTTATLSSLKNAFYVHLPTITNGMYDAVTEDELFVGNPNAVRATWTGIGAVVGIGIAGLAFLFFKNPVAIFPAVIAGGIVAAFAMLMPRKPLRGVQELAEALGFKEFLARVERDQLERLFKEDPLLFDKYIPYAMVLGVADEWAAQFEGLYTEPPSWYYSPGYSRGFYPRMFVNDLGRGLNTMGSTFASRPSQSAGSGGSAFGGGGGFSGGGFGGGGGGGAW